MPDTPRILIFSGTTRLDNCLRRALTQLDAWLEDRLRYEQITAAGRDVVEEHIVDFLPQVIVSAFMPDQHPDRFHAGEFYRHVELPGTVMRAAARRSIPYVYVSSQEVFWPCTQGWLDESSRCFGPVSGRGVAYLAGERDFIEQQGYGTFWSKVLLRTGELVTTDPEWLAALSPSEYCEKADAAWSWLLLSDFAIALVQIIAAHWHGTLNGTYHLSNPGLCSRFEFGQQLYAAQGLQPLPGQTRGIPYSGLQLCTLRQYGKAPRSCAEALTAVYRAYQKFWEYDDECPTDAGDAPGGSRQGLGHADPGEGRISDGQQAVAAGARNASFSH